MQRLLLASLVAFSSSIVWAEDRDADPDSVIKNDFWGNLYKDGGETFYCKKPFSTNNPLLTESYVYSRNLIQNHLKCGTNTQCKRKSARYRVMLSDLHNIVPANAYFEFKRGDAVFGALDSTVAADDCGVRRRAYFIEPPDNIKGDIARIMLYMHSTYDVPLIASLPDLVLWNKMDPPSKEEKQRDEAITKIQGAGNPYVTTPSLVNNIEN